MKLHTGMTSELIQFMTFHSNRPQHLHQLSPKVNVTELPSLFYGAKAGVAVPFVFVKTSRLDGALILLFDSTLLKTLEKKKTKLV